MVTLETPVELIQDDWEFNALLDLYREHAPTRVLEIGAGHGGTLYHWLRNAALEATVVSVDDKHTNAALYPTWTPTGVELVTIRGDSHDFDTIRDAWRHGPYDWVFIDADHHEHQVRDDWVAYGQRLTTPGAIVAFHDILESKDPSVQVAPLWHELRDKHESVELIEDGGFGIGVVFMPDNDEADEPHG